MRLARVLGGFGRLLMWVGALILLFVAHQLWGTNLVEARAQDDLEADFEELLIEAPDERETTTRSTRPGDTTTTTTEVAGLLESPAQGEPVARIEIPEIGVDKIVVEGVRRNDLRKGPGHYPGTPLPGQPGNASIAGHRTTYGAPFHRIDELKVDDEITVTTVQGRFTYRVIGQEIVSPTQVEVIEDQGDDRLTLTSCHPKYSAAQRIILTAALVGEAADPTVRPLKEVDQSIDAAPAIEAETLDGEETGEIEPVILIGLLVLVVWVFFYLLGRIWRRLPAYALGVVPFGGALWVWFGAIAELLPANY